MTRRLVTLLALCAAQPALAQKDDKQRIAPVGAFDVGTCFAQPPATPERATKETLVGVLLGARPKVLECLVDPKSRGPAKATKATLEATVAEAGPEVKVTGDNLTPEGTACVKGALESWVKAVPALDGKHNLEPAKPLLAHLDFVHNDANDATVVLGLNDASDVTGAIRLAEPSFCDCFADWRSAAPRQLKAKVKLTKGKTPDPVSPEVTFEPAGDPTGDKVAACLKGKVSALKLKAPATATLELPYPFKFVHSGISENLPGATPDLQFLQFDLERGRANAEAAIAAGGRTAAADEFATLGKTYNSQGPEKKVKKGQVPPKRVTMQQVKDSCAALLKADDGMTAGFEKVLSVETRTHAFAAEQKAKDAAWAPAEAATAQAQATAQKFVEDGKKNRAADDAVCAKLK